MLVGRMGMVEPNVFETSRERIGEHQQQSDGNMKRQVWDLEACNGVGICWECGRFQKRWVSLRELYRSEIGRSIRSNAIGSVDPTYKYLDIG